MFAAIVNIVNWLVGEVGSASQRQLSRALAFIRDASARAAVRKALVDKIDKE